MGALMDWASGPFGPFTFAGYGIALLLLGVALILTRRVTRSWRVALRACLAAVLLAPGILIDPAVVFSAITPGWLFAGLYGFMMIQAGALHQIGEFFQLMGYLVCGPFLISGPIIFLVVWGLARSLDRRA
jgi:hypothetical protein